VLFGTQLSADLILVAALSGLILLAESKLATWTFAVAARLPA
jgi:hypothetical protein